MNTNPESLRPKIKYYFTNEFDKLNKEKITPWAFFRTDAMQPITKFDGTVIHYRGIEFSGSAMLVFWEGFIEPFLQDIIVRGIDWTIDLSQQYKYPPKNVLLITKNYLLNGIEKSYGRMQEIDRRLRGKGYPESVPLKDISGKIKQMEKFLDEHINSAILYSQNILNETQNKELIELHPNLYGIGFNLKELWRRIAKIILKLLKKQ